MIICTYATHSDGYYPILVKQCEKLKLKLVTLGMGEKWEGFTQKYTDIYKYLISLSDTEIVLFTDGYDSIPVCNEETILKKYNKVKGNKHIVYCIEKRKGITYYTSYYAFGKCNNNFINSGSYIGRVKELKILINNFLKQIKYKKKLDDQVALTKFCNTDNIFNDLVNLDKNNEIFYNIQYENILNYFIFKYTTYLNIKIENNKIITNNNSYPCIFLGTGGVDLNILIKHLGYDFKNERLDKYKYFLFKNFYKNFILFLIQISIIIIIIFTIYKSKKSINKLYIKYKRGSK